MFDFNIYVQNEAFSIRNFARNKRVESILDEASSIDPIEDFPAFREFVVKLKRDVIKEGAPLGFGRIASESLFYGHLKSLVNYSGESFDNGLRLLLPNIEHGIAWVQRVPANVLQPYVHCTVSQGAYRTDAIHAARPWLPHYKVGPYIHYAEPFYSQQAMQSLKKKFGRTLLVFPAHTYELSHVDIAKELFVDSIFDKFASDFDTIVVSAYWHDADDELFRYFENRGAKVVSSGMRDDCNFIRRLKTIISLSDKAIGNALGTNIGYCEYLGVPFEMFKADSTNIDDVGNAYTNEETAELARATNDVTKACSQPGDRTEFSRIYKSYWGGSESIKTQEEIRCILDISREVLDLSKGFTAKFPWAVSYVLDHARSENSHDCAMKQRLLEDALGIKSDEH